jgi:ELWxxDGT repeat protein
VNGTLFFAADDGTNGIELWKSDGTAAGTVRVKNIRPGSGGSSPRYLTNVNGTVFFAANDGTNGIELWKSNGTAAGTIQVKDIHPGSFDSNPSNLTNVNGTLFFAANDGLTGAELWKSDGTAAGTVLVQDIRPGPITSYVSKPANVNGMLFFYATEGTTGYELWKLTAFADDFNRPNSTHLGPDWTEVAGNLAIVDGKLMVTGRVGGTAFSTLSAPANVRVSSRVTLLTSGTCRVDLLARARDAANGYVASLIRNSGRVTASIRKLVSGTATTLASRSVSITLDEASLRFEAVGSVLKLFVDDVLVASVIDTTYRSGKVGVGGTRYVSIDDFFVSAVDAALPFGESFERNVDTSDIGSQWRELSGDLSIRGNELEAEGTGVSVGIYQWSAVRNVCVQAWVSVDAPLGSGLSGRGGVVARYSGPGDGNYYLGAISGRDGVFSAGIYRNVGGRLTRLGGGPLGTGSGLLRLEVVGDSLRLYVDGVLVVRVVDSQIRGAGYVGVSGTRRSTFDEFGAWRQDPVLFFDGFNRSDGVDLGGQWVDLRGGVGVVGNRAEVTSSGTAVAVREGVLLRNVSLEARVSVLVSGVSEAGLVARGVDGRNYYYASLEGVGGVYQVSVYRVVDNVRTRIGSAGTVGSSTGRLRFEVVGTSLKLYFDDVLRVTVTDGTFMRAGWSGMRGSLGTTFDDLTIS